MLTGLTGAKNKCKKLCVLSHHVYNVSSVFFPCSLCLCLIRLRWRVGVFKSFIHNLMEMPLKDRVTKCVQQLVNCPVTWKPYKGSSLTTSQSWEPLYFVWVQGHSASENRNFTKASIIKPILAEEYGRFFFCRTAAVLKMKSRSKLVWLRVKLWSENSEWKCKDTESE